MSELRVFDGGVALITGGASGIGKAIGEAIAKRGATTILADRDHADAGNVAEEIQRGGGKAEAAALDVTDAEAFAAVAAKAKADHGRIDYLFNNAGIAIGGAVEDYETNTWDRVFDVNIRGVAYGVQAVYATMREQGFGHIINTASMAGLGPMPMAVSYCASKHAVVGLSQSLRIEAAEFGVRVSVLCPGAIRTPILVDGGKHGHTVTPIPADLQIKQWEQARPMAPATFAEKVLDDTARNPAVIIVPHWWKWIWRLNRLSPSLALWVAQKGYRDVKALVDDQPSPAAEPERKTG